MERRLIQTEESREDLVYEPKIRPKMLSDYIGQETLKEMLSIYIEAAKKRKQSLDHCLFYGPPGLGKTTISNIIANELGVNCKITSGPAIEKPGEMAAILNSLSEGDVLFVDDSQIKSSGRRSSLSCYGGFCNRCTSWEGKQYPLASLGAASFYFNRCNDKSRPFIGTSKRSFRNHQ